MLTRLDYDVWMQVYWYLSPFDLINLRNVSKSMYKTIDESTWKTYFGRLGFRLPKKPYYNHPGWWMVRNYPCETCWNVSSGKLCLRHYPSTKGIYFEIRSIYQWILQSEYELEECILHIEGLMLIKSEPTYGGSLRRFSSNTAKMGFLFKCVRCTTHLRARRCFKLACKKCCKSGYCSVHT